MTIVSSPAVDDPSSVPKRSAALLLQEDRSSRNPVLDSAEYALNKTDLVQLNEDGIKTAAQLIHRELLTESYTPRTWRTHPLHLLPPEPFSPTDPKTAAVLNWIFLISSLNFSFWSEKEGNPDRFGIEWREGWDSSDKTVHTGYWSLVAAIDRALEEGIPITDPAFYSSEASCPDSLVEHIFRPASRCDETIPLIKERIAILREVGSIMVNSFGGSFQTLISEFQKCHHGRGTALQLVKMITDTFPSFRDETTYAGRRIFIWKRAQILVAETWAAFYPSNATIPHPLFPSGAAMHELTMFADYRVPQILHHLRIITYPPSLLDMLRAHTYLETGCREEVSIRAASIVAVERVRVEMNRLAAESRQDEVAMDSVGEPISSVLIDFFLWDLAKNIESGARSVEGTDTAEIMPAHRTRSIWY